MAKDRDCSMLFFSEIMTFDYCIYKIQPHFDKLSKIHREEVALNLVIYGGLDTSSAHQFLRLIHPYRPEIINYLSEVSDDMLIDQYKLNQFDITEYRNAVEILMNNKEPR